MIDREPQDVSDLYLGVTRLLDQEDANGRKIGSCKHGVYLFVDYDGEPIYVGQTYENLRARIRRHLTNQRTDAVAMSVLDPFEVAEIELWPFWRLREQPEKAARATLLQAEYTVYCQVIKQSSFHAILNEAHIPPTELIAMPQSYRGSVRPARLRTQREHPDVRLARRARTIANLARIVSERKVGIGIRNTLLVQARRLEHLARQRIVQLDCN